MLLACLKVTVEDAHNAQIVPVAIKGGSHDKHYHKAVSKSWGFAAVNDDYTNLLPSKT